MNDRYQAYPEYKNSEVEWLDEIPSHWKMIKLSFGLRLRSGDTITSESIEPEGSFPVYGGNGIRGFTKTHNCEGHYVLIGRQGALCGNINQASGKFFASEHAIVVYPNASWNTRYLAGMLEFMNLGKYSVSAAQPGVSVERLNMLRAISPPLPEQTQIAKFLEHETAKIDRLIEKQQALIALLKEKRQAVISHAVTKGLNPHAPLKDSGIEWLGQVPAHWVLKNYRYASRIYRGKFGHRPRNDPAFYDGKYPFIQTGDIARAEKNITSYGQTLNERGIAVSQKFPAGTLVMAIAANIGDTAILGFEAYAPDSVVGFKPCDNVDLEFLRYSLMAALPALEQTSTQSAQANLNIDRIGSIQAAFPPIAEQRKIVIKIEALIQSFGTIEAKAMNAIELMQERRTALISAAVTGKIDVRAWRPPVVSKMVTTAAAPPTRSKMETVELAAN